MVEADIELITTEQAEIIRGEPIPPGRILRGSWGLSTTNRWGIIFVITSVHRDIDELDETIHHERCHAKLFVYTGDYRFHD